MAKRQPKKPATINGGSLPPAVEDLLFLQYDKWCDEHPDMQADAVCVVERRGTGWFVPDKAVRSFDKVVESTDGSHERITQLLRKAPPEGSCWVIEAHEDGGITIHSLKVQKPITVFGPDRRWLPVDLPQENRALIRNVYLEHLLKGGAVDVVALLIQSPGQVHFERFASREIVARTRELVCFQACHERLARPAPAGRIWVLQRPNEGKQRAVWSLLVGEGSA